MKVLVRNVVLVCVALMTLSACSGSSSSKFYDYDGDQTSPHLIPISQRKPAADFSGSLLSGKGTYDLAKDAAGKITVVNFWGAWCNPCQAETPNFQKIYAEYRAKGATFVGIDIKEASRGLPRAFVAEHHITFPIVYDDEGRTAVTLGNIPSQAVPFTIVLDRHHRVAAVYVLPLTAGDLDPALDSLIAES